MLMTFASGLLRTVVAMRACARGCAVALLALLAPALRAQTFDIGPSQIDIVVPVGLDHLPISVPITRAAGSTGALVVTSDANWVAGTIAAGENTLRLTFSTAALVNRTYTATLTAVDGSQTDTLFVRATISTLNVVVLRDDPVRSRTYGLHQDGTNAGALIVFNPIAGTYAGALTLGRHPSDFDVSRDGAELIAINSFGQNLSVVNLATLAVSDTIALPAYTDWGPSETSAHIAMGPAGIIYYSDGAWAPNLRVLERATRTIKQTLLLSDQGFGGFAVSNNRTRLYAWSQYGWSAGVLSTAVARFAIGADGALTQQQLTAPVYLENFQRDPLGAPVLLNDDGSRLFIKSRQFDPGDLSTIVRTVSGNAAAISPGGEILSTANAIYEVATGNKVFDLPVTTSVQTVTSDYARLVYFDGTARALKTIDLVQAVGLTILGRELTPAMGAIVLPPTALRWSPVPGIDRYRVYLGESATAVDTAGPASPEYRGEVTTSSLTLTQSLVPGRTYYWRIDPVSGVEVSKGQVYSFSVATIGTDRSSISVMTVRGHANFATSLQLTSAAPGKAWTASSSATWIKFPAATGVTPATLAITLDASALEPGTQQGTITITAPEGSFTVPVQLTVDPLALTILRSDASTALVYGISEVTDSYYTGGRAYLLEIDAQAKSIRRVARVGSSVTDLAIHRGDNRIYVTNWRGGSVLALGLTSLELERTYGFSPIPNSTYGGDAFRIAAGGAGRLVVEEQDQWIDVSLLNTATGAIAAKTFQREGGGIFAPGGRYYYHGDNNSSGAEIRKLDTAADQFVELAHSRPGNNGSYYGSRTVVLSDNGQRLFWAGSIYDANLAMVWSPGDIVYSATGDGGYAFSETRIYDVAAQQAVLSMPVSTKVSAYNTTAGALVVQNGTRIGFYPFVPGAALIAPVLTAEAASATSVRLTWTDEGLENSFTVQRRATGAATWIDAGLVSANTTTLTVSSLSPATAYEFRVKADGTSTSSAWSNVVTVTTPAAPPVITTHPVGLAVTAGSPATFSVVVTSSATPSYQWRKSSVAIAGATAATFTIPSAQASDAGSYDVVVTNSAGSVTSFTALLTVSVPPTITLQPTSQTVAPGANAIFTLAASGSPTLTYRWQRQAAGTIGFITLNNGSTYSGATSVTLTVVGATSAMSGDQFRCIVSNGGDATSVAVTLTVQLAPTFTSGTSATFTAGLPGSFLARATGSPAPQFSASGLPAWAALDAMTGVLSGTPPSTAGSPFSIVLTATNGVLPNATQNFTLSVQTGTGLPTITTQPAGKSVGVGANVTFVVVASGAAPLSYEWRKDGVSLSGATTASYTITNATTDDAGRYSVVVRNNVGSVVSQEALLSVVPPDVTATHTVIGPGYVPGSPVTITNTLAFPGTAAALAWQVLIPEGWTYVSGAGAEGDVKPIPGATGLIEWAWTSAMTGPITFSYTLNVPAAQLGDKEIAALVTMRLGASPIQLLALPDPLAIRRATVHAADTNGDGKISVFELTRVVELYNVRNGTVRTGSYRVEPTGEDGFGPDPSRTSVTSVTLARYHSADTSRDGMLGLTELTRVIELYNFRTGTVRTGQYHLQGGTEDGFAPGP